MRRYLRCALAWLAFVAIPGISGAQDIPGYPSVDSFDPREVALLPAYCKYTTYFNRKVPGGSDITAIKSWQSALGPTFEHVHHYCFGLMKTNRAVLLSTNVQVRDFYLTDSLKEFDYVLERSSENFVLLPEILAKKGENLLRLKRAPLAMMEFERAVSLKPDYWPPFAQMSDYYKSIGDNAKARESLERGLAGSPDAPALTRRLQELASAAKAPAKSASRTK